MLLKPDIISIYLYFEQIPEIMFNIVMSKQINLLPKCQDT
jgi:hypothetical protein